VLGCPRHWVTCQVRASTLAPAPALKVRLRVPSSPNLQIVAAHNTHAIFVRAERYARVITVNGPETYPLARSVKIRRGAKPHPALYSVAVRCMLTVGREWKLSWEHRVTDQPVSFSLYIDAGPEADDEESDVLARRLREDLFGLDLDSVELVREGPAKAGTKGHPLTLGALAVTLAPVMVTALMNMLQSWLSRHKEAVITVKGAQGEIAVTGVPSKEQQQVIKDWLSRQKV